MLSRRRLRRRYRTSIQRDHRHRHRKGDIHDIGKNIVKVILENYGYDIIDLGKDVEPQRVVDAVKEKDVKLVGLSADDYHAAQYG